MRMHPEAVVIPSEVEGSAPYRFRGDPNDGTRILNGDHAERAGSLHRSWNAPRATAAGHYRQFFLTESTESTESTENGFPGRDARARAPCLSIHNPKWF